MRIVHTSDWHLGQRFLGESREKEHKAFLDWLIEIIDRDEIDALVVSGDIFDTKNPPSYAKKLYNDFLAKAIKTKCKNIIIVGGNHDSAVGLNEQKRLLENLNIFIVGGAIKSVNELIFEIKSGKRVVGVISAIPYLSETHLRDAKKSADENDRTKALEDAIARYYKKAYKISNRLAKKKGVPNIATGHLSTISKNLSDGVRDIYIGTLEVFNKNRFPPFDYIALGHYHKKLISKNIAYSGSPIILSFDEANYKKFVLDVEISTNNKIDIKDIEVPKFRDIFTLKGDILEIEEKLKEIELNSPIKPAFVELKITKQKSILDVSRRVDELNSSSIKILKFTIEKESEEVGLNRLNSVERLEDITIESVFLKRLERENFNEEAKKRLLNRFIQIKDMVELDEN
jgi:exonuclease SbcD